MSDNKIQTLTPGQMASYRAYFTDITKKEPEQDWSAFFSFVSAVNSVDTNEKVNTIIEKLESIKILMSNKVQK